MSVAPVRETPLPSPAPPTSGPTALRSATGPPALDRTDGPSPFARILHGLGHEVQRGETLVRGAVASASGGELSPASLIALQAGVYRYSEVVDLAARLVDHATTALKTVVQNQ